MSCAQLDVLTQAHYLLRRSNGGSDDFEMRSYDDGDAATYIDFNVYLQINLSRSHGGTVFVRSCVTLASFSSLWPAFTLCT